MLQAGARTAPCPSISTKTTLSVAGPYLRLRTRRPQPSETESDLLPELPTETRHRTRNGVKNETGLSPAARTRPATAPEVRRIGAPGRGLRLAEIPGAAGSALGAARRAPGHPPHVTRLRLAHAAGRGIPASARQEIAARD
jgi:hypothetical protein